MARKKKVQTDVTSETSSKLPEPKVTTKEAVEVTTVEPAKEEFTLVETMPVESPKEVTPEAIPTVEESEPVKEDPELVKPTIAVPETKADLRERLVQRIMQAAPKSFIKTGSVDQWLKVLRNKGTLGVTHYGKVVFLNQISPENGGKEILNKKYNIREFITDME